MFHMPVTDRNKPLYLHSALLFRYLKSRVLRVIIVSDQYLFVLLTLHNL